MKLFNFIRKQPNSTKEKNAKRISYTFDSVFPSEEIYEIAMGIRTEETTEKNSKD